MAEPIPDPASAAPSPQHGPDVRSPAVAEALRRYWRQNVRIMIALLAVWAVVSLVVSILLADRLNAMSLGGMPLGFWFAQQGSILAFLVLILVYAVVLNRLDAKHHRELLGRLGNAGGGAGESSSSSSTER